MNTIHGMSGTSHGDSLFSYNNKVTIKYGLIHARIFLLRRI